jgi:hypothetical protein
VTEIRELKPSPSKTSDSGMTSGQFSFGTEEIYDTESSEDWDMDPVKRTIGLKAY